MNLTTATPVEIDTELYRLDGEAAKAERSLHLALVLIHRAVGDDTGYRKPDYALTHEQAIEQAKVKAGTEGDFLRAAEKALESLKKATAEVEAVAAQQRPLNAEYARRPWTRAYLALVNGNGGHVHSSTDCSTCNNGKYRTQFARQAQYSGADEATIIADAGYRACTVCYKDAPVEATPESHPTKIFSQDEIDRQAARAEREAKKAAREAKRLEKALLPDGTTLRVPTDGSIAILDTLAQARTWLTDSYWWRAGHPSFPASAQAIIAEAVAAKEGKTVEVVLAEAKTRAAKRK